MNFDLVIHSARVATSAKVVDCNIGIRGGHIVALGNDLGTASVVIDAIGLIALPGKINSLDHIAQPSGPGIEIADDFASATQSATLGSFTMVMPFLSSRRRRHSSPGRERLSCGVVVWSMKRSEVPLPETDFRCCVGN